MNRVTGVLAVVALLSAGCAAAATTSTTQARTGSHASLHLVPPDAQGAPAERVLRLAPAPQNQAPAYSTQRSIGAMPLLPLRPAPPAGCRAGGTARPGDSRRLPAERGPRAPMRDSLAGSRQLLSVSTWTWVMCVSQLASDERVPLQLPNGLVAVPSYVARSQVCPMYSDAIHTEFPSATAAP
jgi:hypothetical protein